MARFGHFLYFLELVKYLISNISAQLFHGIQITIHEKRGLVASPQTVSWIPNVKFSNESSEISKAWGIVSKSHHWPDLARSGCQCTVWLGLVQDFRAENGNSLFSQELEGGVSIVNRFLLIELWVEVSISTVFEECSERKCFLAHFVRHQKRNNIMAGKVGPFHSNYDNCFSKKPAAKPKENYDLLDSIRIMKLSNKWLLGYSG